MFAYDRINFRCVTRKIILGIKDGWTVMLTPSFLLNNVWDGLIIRFTVTKICVEFKRNNQVLHSFVPVHFLSALFIETSLVAFWGREWASGGSLDYECQLKQTMFPRSLCHSLRASGIIIVFFLNRPRQFPFSTMSKLRSSRSEWTIIIWFKPLCMEF